MDLEWGVGVSILDATSKTFAQVGMMREFPQICSVQQFSDFTWVSHLEDLLKHRLLGPVPQVYDSVGLC